MYFFCDQYVEIRPFGVLFWSSYRSHARQGCSADMTSMTSVTLRWCQLKCRKSAKCRKSMWKRSTNGTDNWDEKSTVLSITKLTAYHVFFPCFKCPVTFNSNLKRLVPLWWLAWQLPAASFEIVPWVVWPRPSCAQYYRQCMTHMGVLEHVLVFSCAATATPFWQLCAVSPQYLSLLKLSLANYYKIQECFRMKS